MLKKQKISAFTFIILFSVFYPILPVYFRVGSVVIRDILAIVCLFFVFLLKNEKKIVISNREKNIIFVIVLWACITAIIQLYHGEQYRAFKSVFLWCLMVPTVIQIINSKKRFILVIDVIIGCSTIIGLFGILEEVTHFNVFNLINTAHIELNYNSLRFGLLRIISFTSHAITYCNYCMFILALIFYRLSLKETKNKARYKIAYMIIAINAIFTLSRLSIMCLIFCQLLLLWLSGRRFAFKKILRIIGILTILVVLGCIVSAQFRYTMSIAVYTVLAIFNDNYVYVLRNVGLTDNTQAIGNRLDLYQWVYEKVAPNYLLGKGYENAFRYSFRNSDGYKIIKESIEVEYLQTFYYYGLLGMISEIYFYLTCLTQSVKRMFKVPARWEGNISFARAFFAIVCSYVLTFFGVMQNEDAQLFLMLIILFISYIRSGGFEDDKYSNMITEC